MTIKLTREFEQFRGLEISWILRGRVEMKAQKTGAMHMSVEVWRGVVTFLEYTNKGTKNTVFVVLSCFSGF